MYDFYNFIYRLLCRIDTVFDGTVKTQKIKSDLLIFEALFALIKRAPPNFGGAEI